jgi:WD40 repeat protein
MPPPVIRALPAPSVEGIFLAAKCVSLYESRVDITDLSNRSVITYNLGDLDIKMSNPKQAVFNENGRFLAFAVQNTLVALDRTAAMQQLTTFTSDDDVEFRVLKIHDRNGEIRLIAASKDCQIAVLDLINKRALITLQTTCMPGNMAICQNDTLLVSSGDAFLRRWDLRNLESNPLQTVSIGEHIFKMAQSPDKTRIAILDSNFECELWDAESLQKIKRFQNPNGNDFLTGFSFIDDNRVLLREPLKQDITIWNTENDQSSALSFSEKLLPQMMGFAHGYIIVGTPSGAIKIYNPDTSENFLLPSIQKGVLKSIGVFENGAILM